MSTDPILYEHTTDGSARGSLRLLQLYPRDMNIYGDWGNTLTLARRAQWQGYDVEVLAYDPGDEPPTDVDLVVGGGGQDSGQERIKADLVERAANLRAWAADGVPMLVICGLYQLFGHRFVTATGGEIPGIGVFDAETVAGPGEEGGGAKMTAVAAMGLGGPARASRAGGGGRRRWAMWRTPVGRRRRRTLSGRREVFF